MTYMRSLYLHGFLHALVAVSSISILHSQTFELGSNGSYGAITLTQSQQVTLQVPPDGVFHCTTISLAFRSRLTFSKNAANTPVYLLATGDITMGSEAVIDVSGNENNGIAPGIGGPGGFDGGQGGDTPGDGQGPGGGKSGWVANGVQFGAKPGNLEYRGSGSFTTKSSSAAQTTTAGNTYGNALLLPMIGGSGGGGGKASTLQYAFGGGGGGGAILLASNTRIVFETGSPPVIRANGGGAQTSEFGNGSGGSIRLVAAAISGSPNLAIEPSNLLGSFGGYGRIRIDSFNIAGFSSNNSGSGNSPRSRDFITYGSNMTVFPPDFPGLRITQVGTQVIPGTQVAPVFVLFPAGSPATQTVTVSCTNFNSTVPLRAVVTPQSGSTQTFDFTVDNTAGGTTTGTVDVQIPAGVASRVDVWTR
jgi:hypothetical protein